MVLDWLLNRFFGSSLATVQWLLGFQKLYRLFTFGGMVSTVLALSFGFFVANCSPSLFSISNL